MKLPSLIAAAVFSALVPALAITDADITPAALTGKTLTFTIEHGSAPYATKGTWSGTFAASGNGFTITRIKGDTVNLATTFSAATNGTFTDVSLAKFIKGGNPATLTVYNMAGVGHYEVVIDGHFGTGQNGTFKFASTVVNAPEIDVLHNGKKLADGSARIGFSPVKIGKSSAAEKLVIKNSGKAKLTGLKISRNGANQADFKVSALAKTSLAPGESMAVKVIFKPGAAGKKSAAIHIFSNDANESPFDIKLTGTGAK